MHLQSLIFIAFKFLANFTFYYVFPKYFSWV